MHERPPPVRTTTIWHPYVQMRRFRLLATAGDEWYAQGVYNSWDGRRPVVYLAHCGQPFELTAESVKEAYQRIASFVRLAVRLYMLDMDPPPAWLAAYDTVGAWPRWSQLDNMGDFEDSARRARRRQGFPTAHRLTARS